MTQPVPQVQGETVPDEESLTFEALAVVAVAGSLASLVSSLLGGIYAAWEVTSGATFGREVAGRIRAEVPHLPELRPALVRVAAEARDLGQDRAVRRFPDPADRERAAGTDWRTRGITSVLPDVDRTVTEALLDAARIAESLPFERKADVHSVAGRIRQGLSRAQGSARWTATEGINAGTAEVARTMGLRLIWVAERNACLHCLAHAGWSVEPGQVFPPVSFDPLAKRIPAVPWPPLHPNCRCQVRTWSGPPGAPSPDRSRVDPAARIAAEARRSVVYQWTDYASKAGAQRAAEALLRAGADLPATVERRARTALRRGGVRRPR